MRNEIIENKGIIKIYNKSYIMKNKKHITVNFCSLKNGQKTMKRRANTKNETLSE